MKIRYPSNDGERLLGTPATVEIGNDRYPYTVINASRSGNTIYLQRCKVAPSLVMTPQGAKRGFRVFDDPVGPVVAARIYGARSGVGIIYAIKGAGDVVRVVLGQHEYSVNNP